MKTSKCAILMVAACMAMFVGCKDDDATDYRDAWVGTYVGDSNYHYSANGGANTLDTIYSNDRLSVAKNGDDGLTIDYRSQSYLVKCTEDGVFSHDNYPHGGCEGRCVGDSLYFMSTESFTGQVATYNYKGKKIK